MKKNWKNLEENRCPICGSGLEIIENDYRICKNNTCTFSISKYKIDEILDNLGRQERNEELEGFGLE